MVVPRSESCGKRKGRKRGEKLMQVLGLRHSQGGTAEKGKATRRAPSLGLSADLEGPEDRLMRY